VEFAGLDCALFVRHVGTAGTRECAAVSNGVEVYCHCLSQCLILGSGKHQVLLQAREISSEDPGSLVLFVEVRLVKGYCL
jgi:hypothetical protein